MADMESLLLTLIEKEIPEGRQALRDGHENLAKVAAYCEQKYLDTNNRFKSGPDRDKVLEETRAVLDETKQFATQSLASVAYQINSLALNMLSLLDQQALKLQDMESRINHIGETVNIHKEKVARREIGVLATNKLTGRTHRIIAPAEQEKAKRYNRKQTDYTLLDDFGHGVKTGDRPELRRRTSSRKAKSPAPAGNEGSLRQRMPGGGTSRRPPLTVKPPPPPVPPPMPPSVPPGMASEPPPPPVSSVTMPPMAPSVPVSMTMAPPPPLATSFSGASSPPPPPGVPGVPAPPPPPVLGGGPVPAPPPPPALSLPLGANLPPPDVIPPSDLGAGAGAYESMADVMSPLPPPPPSAEDFYQSPSSLPMPAPPEDLYETPPAAMMVPPPPPISQEDWVPQVYLEKVVALYDYEQQREDELTFSEGATVYVIKKNDDGWFEGVMQGGATGLFPGNYVEVCL